MSALTRSLRDLVGASSGAVRANREVAETQTSIQGELIDFTNTITKGRVATKRQNELVNEATKLKRKELELEQRLRVLRKLEADTRARANASQTEIAAAHERTQRAVEHHGAAVTATNKATLKAENSFKGFTAGLNAAGAALAMFGTALRMQYGVIKAQVEATSGIVEGSDNLLKSMASQQNLAIQFGVAGDELARLASANRQVFNAMGGTERALSELTPAIKQLQIQTGFDFVRSMKLASQAAASLAKTGIRPTGEAMNVWMKDIQSIQKLGLASSMEEAASMFDELASDANMIELLRSARKGERAAILETQRAMVKQAGETGILAEQAKAASRMLAQMVSAKPLDRLKQAARIRAMGGAMGIKGSEEAARAVISGGKTPAELKAIEAFSKNAANAVNEARQSGQLGTEIFATELIEKLNLSQQYGANSPFSTALAAEMRPNTDALAKLYQLTDTGQAGTWRKMEEIKAQLELILSGKHWGGMLVASMGAIAAFMLRGKLASMLASVTSSALARAGSLVRGAGGAAAAVGEAATVVGNTSRAATGAAGSAAAAGSTMGKVSAAAKKLGALGAVVDVGSGLMDLAEGNAQTNMSGWDMISPMRWGMYAGNQFNETVEKATGTSFGSKLYDWFGDDGTAAKITAPTNPSNTIKANQLTTDAVNTAKDTHAVTTNLLGVATTTADAAVAQVKKTDSVAELLRKASEVSQKQLDVAEKQLQVLTTGLIPAGENVSFARRPPESKFTSRYATPQ